MRTMGRRELMRRLALGSLAAVAASMASQFRAYARSLERLPFTGVNIAGGEFFEPARQPRPVYGRDFIYPSPEQLDYFVGKGVNIIRVPFRWETLQPAPNEPLDGEEIKRLRGAVQAAAARDLTVILDPHNYARYRGRVIGGKELPDGLLADFWARLAAEFSGERRVWFGLMNEPHDMPTEQWLAAANGAIAAIRAVGANNVLLVPGNGWSNAAGWHEDWYGTPNSVAMLQVVDPRKNFLIETHLYFDKDGSGKSDTVVSPTIGSERLSGFTRWCREHGLRAFLGEFAVPATPVGRAAVRDVLDSMERDWDVWAGFAWWAAGAWWDSYMFSLEPRNGNDSAQLAFLQPYLQQPSLTVRRGR